MNANTTKPAPAPVTVWVWGTEVTDEGETVNVVHPAIPGDEYYPENIFPSEEEAWAAIAAYEAE